MAKSLGDSGRTGTSAADVRTPWFRTWWGRVVAVAGIVGGVVGTTASAVELAKNFGWYTPPDMVASPVETPGPPEADPPEPPTYGGGWGPARDTFTIAVPAPYAALNSITDNPVHGDERNFVQMRLVDESNEAYADKLLAFPGDEIVVYAYVANNAADNLGIAATVHGLNARVIIGTPELSPAVAVIYGGTNVKDVWDGATVVSDEPIRLEYIEDSAYFHANGGGYEVEGDFGNGQTMTLGQYSQDGMYPIGWKGDVYQGNGYLTFRVRVVEG